MTPDVEKALAYFQRLNECRQQNKQMSLMSIFKNKSNLNKHGLQANYELSFPIAKKSRPHIGGEELLKLAFEIYLGTMLNSGKVGHQLSSLPLSNNTVHGHIDEIVNDIQSQLNDILRNTNFSLALVFQTSAISTTYLVECAFSAATDILTKKKGTLEICER